MGSLHEGVHPARHISSMLTQEQLAHVVAFCLDVGRSPLTRALAQCRPCRIQTSRSTCGSPCRNGFKPHCVSWSFRSRLFSLLRSCRLQLAFWTAPSFENLYEPGVSVISGRLNSKVKLFHGPFDCRSNDGNI